MRCPRLARDPGGLLRAAERQIIDPRKLAIWRIPDIWCWKSSFPTSRCRYSAESVGRSRGNMKARVISIAKPYSRPAAHARRAGARAVRASPRRRADRGGHGVPFGWWGTGRGALERSSVDQGCTSPVRLSSFIALDPHARTAAASAASVRSGFSTKRERLQVEVPRADLILKPCTPMGAVFYP